MTKAKSSSEQRNEIRLNIHRNEIGGRWMVDGPGNGRPLSIPEARNATRTRLGLGVCEKDELCQRGSAEEGCCGYSLDKWGDHCMSCRQGGMRCRRHGSVCALVRSWGVAAGYACEREVLIPQWRRWVAATKRKEGHWQQAVLDVVMEAHGDLPSRTIDVTIRHEMAESRRAEQLANPEFALLQAQKEKLERYQGGGGAGVKLTTFAVGTSGQIGPEALALMQKLATAAAQERRSWGLPHKPWIAQWQSALSRALAIGSCHAVTTSRRRVMQGAEEAVPPAGKKPVAGARRW